VTDDPGASENAAAAAGGRDRGTPESAAAAVDDGDRGTSDEPGVTAGGRAAGATGDTATRDDAPARSPHVVFCGGCNPHIDRGAVAAELTAAAAGAAKADAGPSRGGATVYLSGCPRACASDHRLTGDEPGDVVVAGETVDGRPTPVDEIAATIRQKLKE
jgi:hypothetical protein